MRIVHVVQCLGLGGQERLILYLSRELQKRGHEPHVISLTPGGDLRPEFASIAVHDVPRRSGVDPLLAMNMARTLLTIKPDVVHTHNPSPMFYAVPVARALHVRRIVHTKHGANIYGPKSLWGARAVVRMLDSLVAVSDGTADVALQKECVPAKTIHVIPNGIPLNDFHADADARKDVRREFSIPEDALVVGSVGRLAKEKDYPLLVRAMKPLLGPSTRLMIVGAGAARPDIEAVITPDIAPFVTLTGMRRDVPRMLAAMDIFSLTSITEGLPLVIPEAFATGLPVVATAVGGLPSIVREDVGLLRPHGDASGLSGAFSELLKDPTRRATMGESARSYALRRFSIEAMTDAYLALYQ